MFEDQFCLLKCTFKPSHLLTDAEKKDIAASKNVVPLQKETDWNVVKSSRPPRPDVSDIWNSFLPAAVGILCVAWALAVLPPSASPPARPRLLSDWIPLGVIDSNMKIREIRGAHWKMTENNSIGVILVTVFCEALNQRFSTLAVPRYAELCKLPFWSTWI